MADDFMSKVAINNVETQKENVLDNIYITPATKTIQIRTIDRYSDAAGKVLRSNAGEQILLREEPADE